MDLVEATARGFDSGPRHPWEIARLRIAFDLVAAHVPLAPGDTVLDIGCGDTFVVEAFARRFPSVQFVAVDTGFTEELIGRWRGRLDVPNVSLYGSLDDMPSSTPPAALVLLMDVIEHVEDDVAFLRDVCARPQITAATEFLITVPSFERLFCAHDRALGHFRRYTTRLLRQRATAAGLLVRDSGYLFASLLPARVLEILRDRMRKSPGREATALATWRGGSTAATAIATLLLIDAKVLLTLRKGGISIPGLSNFAICRKSA